MTVRLHVPDRARIALELVVQKRKGVNAGARRSQLPATRLSAVDTSIVCMT